MRILSIALIGRHNQPLFISSYPPNSRVASRRPTAEEDLKWHFVAHTSLDVFEEREAANPRQMDHYAGLLQIMDDYAVYGYTTSTRVKMVICLALEEETVKDVDVKTLFKALHNAYIAYLSNPFTDAIGPGSSEAALAVADAVQPPIRSVKFERRLKELVDAQNAT